MNNNWLRNTIRSFEPYAVPEIREHTVINANESPYNIFDFPKVKAGFLERLARRRRTTIRTPLPKNCGQPWRNTSAASPRKSSSAMAAMKSSASS